MHLYFLRHGKADWPVDGRVVTHLLLPFRADLAEVIREDKRRAVAIRTVHHYDVFVWQFRSGIECCDFRILPFLDLAQDNAGDRVTIELRSVKPGTS